MYSQNFFLSTHTHCFITHNWKTNHNHIIYATNKSLHCYKRKTAKATNPNGLNQSKKYISNSKRKIWVGAGDGDDQYREGSVGSRIVQTVYCLAWFEDNISINDHRDTIWIRVRFYCGQSVRWTSIKEGKGFILTRRWLHVGCCENTCVWWMANRLAITD